MKKLERAISTAIRLISILALVIWSVGCASVSLRQGREYLDREKYPEALESLTRALSEDPDNPEIHRDLGIAHYGLGEFDKALEELGIAKQELTKDGELMFYLGLTYENLEEYDKAIEEYSNYVQVARFRGIRRKIQRRIGQLNQKWARQWAKERMELEADIGSVSVQDDVIAVTDFKPFGMSEELEPLRIGLTQLLITDLKLVKGLKVVERLMVKELYREMGVSSAEFVDQSTAPKLGKLLGAGTLIIGTFTGVGDRSWRIHPTLGLIKTGDLKELESVGGEFAELLQAEKDLIFEVLAELDIGLTDDIRDNIMRNIPTESLEAFISYSRGLDYLDKGMYSEAEEEFKAAISEDSGFGQARDHLLETQSLSQPMDSVDILEEAWDSELSAHETVNESLATTVNEVSQSDAENELIPEVATPEPREVLLRISW
ncbi:tetratricopeptide repeat protein [Candidatus Poribacteria bacterium]